MSTWHTRTEASSRYVHQCMHRSMHVTWRTYKLHAYLCEFDALTVILRHGQETLDVWRQFFLPKFLIGPKQVCPMHTHMKMSNACVQICVIVGTYRAQTAVQVHIYYKHVCVHTSMSGKHLVPTVKLEGGGWGGNSSNKLHIQTHKHVNSAFEKKNCSML